MARLAQHVCNRAAAGLRMLQGCGSVVAGMQHGCSRGADRFCRSSKRATVPRSSHHRCATATRPVWQAHRYGLACSACACRAHRLPEPCPGRHISKP
eukprot:353654-Chlamydomonas_euryale.AAC.8